MTPPRVVLLGGASGSGKSYLARRHGRPHLALDAYYREISEDGRELEFPRTPYGEIDWDDPRTWNLQAAVDAVVELIETGRTSVPDYSITTSSVTGSRTLHLGETAPGERAAQPADAGAPVIVAEGVFADVAAEPLRQVCSGLGVRLDAYYIDQDVVTTAARRLVRDVAERRKPIPFLLQRGWALARSERGSRARHLAAGFRPVPKARLRSALPTVVG